MGPQFFETQMGHKFYNVQLPALTKAINRLAEAIEKQNNIALGKEVSSSDGEDE